MRDVINSGISPNAAVKIVAEFIKGEVDNGSSVREAATSATNKYDLRSVAQAEWCYDQHYAATA